jgi:hypothetical protein
MKLDKSKLSDIVNEIRDSFTNLDKIYFEKDFIIVEDYYHMSTDEKNDDDCFDNAKEIGEMIIDKFPMLEIYNYYCHRHKYSIVELKLKKKNDKVRI